MKTTQNQSGLVRTLCASLAVALTVQPVLAATVYQYVKPVPGFQGPSPYTGTPDASLDLGAGTGGGSTGGSTGGGTGGGGSGGGTGDGTGGGGSGGSGTGGGTGGNDGSGDSGGSGGTQAALVFAPAMLDFATVATGQSVALSATLTNVGSEAAQSVAVSGAAPFSTSSNCPSTLPAGASCAVQVTFASSAGGTYTRVVGATASGAAAQLVALGKTPGGAAAADKLSMSPSFVDFATVSVGSTSVVRPVTVTNVSSQSVSITGLSMTRGSDVFAQTNNCGTGLAAGASCTINTQFTPVNTNTRSGLITLTLSDGSLSSIGMSGTGQRPVLSTSGTLDFGAVDVGGTQSRTLTLSNTGNVAVTGLATALSGSSAFHRGTDTCGVSLAPAATCTIEVRFTASAMPPVTGTLSITSNELPSRSVAMSGSGRAAQLSFSPAALNFGEQLRQTTVVRTIDVVNTSSSATATITGLSVATGTGSFAQSNSCGTTLAPGASCTVNVAFTPSTTGALTGSLAVVSDAGTATAVLSGIGTSPASALDDPDLGSGSTGPDGVRQYAITFADTVVGNNSAARVITLRNNGTGPLSVSGISVTSGAADFAQSTSCGATVIAGGSCTISVTFTPSTRGTRTGVLTVNTSDQNFTVSMTGKGLQGEATVTPSPIAAPTTQVGIQSGVSAGTVSNTGDAPLTITGVSVSVNPSIFGQSNNCGTTLQPGQTCTVNISFTPGYAGTLTGTLSLVHNGVGSLTNVALSGYAQPQSGTVSGVSFGNVAIGSNSAQTATVTNTGIGPLTFTVPSSASISGSSFSFNGTTCTGSLPVGQSCTVSVKFTPSARGSATGILTLSTGGGPLEASLSGNGQAPGSVTMSAIDFGTQDIGVATSRSATLSNPGDLPVSVTALTAAGTGVSVAAGGASPCALGGAFSIAAGGSCTVNVTWTPAAGGTLSGATLTASYTGGPATATISGTGRIVFMDATGGSVTTSGNYRIHTFTSSGTFTITRAPSQGGIEVLVVGGGGGGAGGGTSVGTGGGGAGGYQATSQNITTTGTVSVTVGNGGNGGAANTVGQAGGASAIAGSPVTTVTALGGGQGGNNSGTAGNGASGGGTACSQGSSGAISVPGTGTAGQGNNGSNGTTGRYGYTGCNGGGGGGAGSAASGSSGGAGLTWAVTGVTYSRGGNGGSGGGGNGAAAAANTGNGGGGANGTGGTGGAGGSGVVIIRYQYQ